MRKTLTSSLLHQRQNVLHSKRKALRLGLINFETTTLTPCRSLAQVRPDREVFNDLWFTSAGPLKSAPEKPGFKDPEAPPDERTLKLGKSMIIVVSKYDSRC